MIEPANDSFEDDEDDKTAIDLVSPFADSMRQDGHSVELSANLAIPHETPLAQLTVDPPTKIVRHDNFRELPPGTIVGENYEVDARLGAGAMGEVYAAHHVRLRKRVAIKVIRQGLLRDDAAIRRFALEAQALAQIQHPSIVAVEHVGELPDGRAYFVMEYLRGESLFDRLIRGRVPLREALRILDQMARGLEAAHGSGIIHRDLKPDNTFLVNLPREKPTIKLLDFGLAKLTAESGELDPHAECSQSGVAIGTPLYMSPEQARGPDVDHRTDIYALGCVAYELVLGVRPFPHARSAPEIYAAHLHAPPPLPRSIWPEIPPQLDLVLFAMLAKDPERRPTLAQVRSVVAGLRMPSQQPATLFVGPRASREKRRRVAIAAAAISALIIGASIGATFGTALFSKHHGSALPESIEPTTPNPPDTTARVEPSPPAPGSAVDNMPMPQDTRGGVPGMSTKQDTRRVPGMSTKQDTRRVVPRVSDLPTLGTENISPPALHPVSPNINTVEIKKPPAHQPEAEPIPISQTLDPFTKHQVNP